MSHKVKARAAPSHLSALAAEINTEHRLACDHARQTIEHAIRCGELLSTAKDRLGHGHFLPWLDKHFDGTPRTAQRYMRFAAHRKSIAYATSVRAAQRLIGGPEQNQKTKCDTVSHLRYWDCIHGAVGSRKRRYDLRWDMLAQDAIALDADGCETSEICDITEMPADDIVAILRPSIPHRPPRLFNMFVTDRLASEAYAEWYWREINSEVRWILARQHESAARRVEYCGMPRLAETIRTLARGQCSDPNEQRWGWLRQPDAGLFAFGCVAMTDARVALRIGHEPVDFFDCFVEHDKAYERCAGVYSAQRQKPRGRDAASTETRNTMEAVLDAKVSNDD